MKNSHHVIRHAPSGELWKFCMDRLRELRGADTRERDLANVLGFEHSRAVRWKEGQMYVDRAEYLLRLADAIEVEPMLLVQLAAGDISVEQAQRQLNRISRQAAEESKKRGKGSASGASSGKGATVAADHQVDRAADGAQFATDPGRFESATRGIALLTAANGAGRAELAAAVARHADVGALVATSLPMGITLAERYRPELAFLDMGLGGAQAFDSIRLLSSLPAKSGRRCRVVAGTSTLTDPIEKAGLMAGAANVVLFPFPAGLFSSELDRLEERLGHRRGRR